MAYESGRTNDQGMRVCVLEGDTLYVSPSRFDLMQRAAVLGEGINPNEHVSEDADDRARMALLFAGLLPEEIKSREHRETKIVVDYELSA